MEGVKVFDHELYEALSWYFWEINFDHSAEPWRWEFNGRNFAVTGYETMLELLIFKFPQYGI